MLSGFKKFILRGNVVDMAVGVVIGAAFGGVVTALTKDLLTPFIAAVVGKPDFSYLGFTIRRNAISGRRLHQRSRVVSPGCRRDLLLRSHAGQCAGGTHAPGRDPS